TDNTARKQVEAAQALLDQQLRDQQFYTRSLIEANLDAMMMTDPHGIISDVNGQMEALTGCARSDLIGAPCSGFFTDPARADAAIARVLAGNKVSDYELTVRARGGAETVVSYNAATFHDREGRLQGVFAAARDVTERKRFERALQEKNAQLERASRMKTEFLATMSHELRTPLNAIIGFSEALGDGLIGEMSASQSEYIGDIFTSGQHLLSLINDILDLSKVEAGMMALELEPVDLHGVLAASLSIVRERALGQRIRLELDAESELGLPLLDLRKTKQILYNLLSNAVKFSAAGSRVRLTARLVDRDAVGRIRGPWPVHAFPLPDNAHRRFIEIGVADEGIGVSAADMAELFQAFRQIDSSLARKFDGTGLGLAMVRQLAGLHGGTVAMASAVDEGARVVVWLPLREAMAPVAAVAGLPRATAAPSPRAAGDQRVALVVEDDERAAELVRLLLAAEGFHVQLAENAEIALEMATRQVPTLITLDLQLPGIDGLEFLARVRASPSLRAVPVVIISGLADGRPVSGADASAVLKKPVSRIELKSSLARLGLDPAPEHARTILVVDQDPKAVEVVAALLPRPAYTVVRAYDGREALALAVRLRPDLVLLDLAMPDFSGFEVLAALRAEPATSAIPVLVVTALEVTAATQTLLDAVPGGRVQVLAKAGFNGEAFVAEVEHALQTH
ncbi:MAG TPA: response regulator, partial [Luteimonas sp.]|nr:response regulator [Luteimonas sp.]